MDYFKSICRLVDETQEEFPVNLDDVWPLVYGRKEEAVRALTTDFQYSEGVDYKVLRKNAENPLGGRPTNEYHLSVSCLEHFIARKKREVFEVYRQFFHGLRRGEIKRTLSRKELALMVIQAEEEKERLMLANKAMDAELKEAAPKVEYHDKVLSSEGYLTVNMIASSLGISDRKLNKLLCDWKVQYKESGCYHLYSDLRGKGYAKQKPYPYTDNMGNIKTKQHLYWTETGKKFIVELYNKKVA